MLANDIRVRADENFNVRKKSNEYKPQETSVWKRWVQKCKPVKKP